MLLKVFYCRKPRFLFRLLPIPLLRPNGRQSGKTNSLDMLMRWKVERYPAMSSLWQGLHRLKSSMRGAFSLAQSMHNKGTAKDLAIWYNGSVKMTTRLSRQLNKWPLNKKPYPGWPGVLSTDLPAKAFLLSSESSLPGCLHLMNSASSACWQFSSPFPNHLSTAAFPRL